MNSHMATGIVRYQRRRFSLKKARKISSSSITTIVE
jgi:hypothetical protein